MGRRVQSVGAVLMSCAVTGAVLGLPAVAGAKGSGLGCLKGKWISDGVRSSAVSGLSGVSLTINGHGSANANYNFSSPLRFAGAKYLIYVRGGASGQFHSSHGHYSFKSQGNSEKISVYLGSQRVKGPTPATSAETPRYAGLKCTAGKLTDQLTVPTKSGTVTVSTSYHRG